MVEDHPDDCDCKGCQWYNTESKKHGYDGNYCGCWVCHYLKRYADYKYSNNSLEDKIESVTTENTKLRKLFTDMKSMPKEVLDQLVTIDQENADIAEHRTQMDIRIHDQQMNWLKAQKVAEIDDLKSQLEKKDKLLKSAIDGSFNGKIKELEAQTVKSDIAYEALRREKLQVEQTVEDMKTEMDAKMILAKKAVNIERIEESAETLEGLIKTSLYLSTQAVNDTKNRLIETIKLENNKLQQTNAKLHAQLSKSEKERKLMKSTQSTKTSDFDRIEMDLKSARVRNSTGLAGVNNENDKSGKAKDFMDVDQEDNSVIKSKWLTKRGKKTTSSRVNVKNVDVFKEMVIDLSDIAVKEEQRMRLCSSVDKRMKFVEQRIHAIFN